MNISKHKRFSPSFQILFVLFMFFNLQVSGIVEKDLYQKSGANNNSFFHSLPLQYNYRATNCILKDYKGLMWFGTRDGLLKYDGINLTVYEHSVDDTNSLGSNIITAILEDKMNNLWIGTNQGLFIYNRNLDNFNYVPITSKQGNSTGGVFIKSLISQSDSIVWIGTNTEGLYGYNINTEKITHFTIENTNGRSGIITCVLADSAGKMWLGTLSGLLLFDTYNFSKRWFVHTSSDPESISGDYISALQKDIYGNIWVGTKDQGINKIKKNGDNIIFEHLSNNSFKTNISSNAINVLYADNIGNLWIGTENDGLNKLDIISNEIEIFKNEPGNESSINSNSIWSIYKDDEGRIWTGSYNKGISVIDENYSKFESIKSNPYLKIGLPNNDVRGFCETKNGKIWIATDGGGICRFDLNTRTFEKVIRADENYTSITNNTVQAILCDKFGDFWIGSWGGGIDRLSPNGKFIKNYKIENKNGLGNNEIRTVYQDFNGNIWVGTNGSGLYLYDKNNDRFELFVYDGLLNQTTAVCAIISETKHTIWIGTLSGLFYIEFDEKMAVVNTKSYTTANSALNNNSVNFIQIDRNKNIWLGTNDGVSLFNPLNDTITVFRKKDGLSSNIISAILEDNSGNLWISTNSGISTININSLEIKAFTTEDGLSSNEFLSRSCLKTKDGDLLFGSTKGFDIIHPEKISYNKNIPNVLLTTLKINNSPVEINTKSSPLRKQLSETDTLILNYKQSSFTIEFVALNYTRPGQNQFSYILEGYDDNWNYIGTNTSANYTQVRTGKYTFKVIASNNDGLWNKKPRNLYIIIQPPIWKTFWAYLLYLFLFTSLIFIIYRIWKERINIRHQLQLERIAKEREHELNEKNLQFFTNISHEFRTPLSLIIGPVESLLSTLPKNMQGQLDVIHKNSQRLLSLTNSIMDIRKLEDGGMQLFIGQYNIKTTIESILDYFKERIKKLNINLTVIIPEHQHVFWFDSEKLNTIMFNLLSNALKYTNEKGNIKIEINHLKTKKQLEISVSNSGIGIEPTELPFVFEKFFQIHSGKKKKQYGSGLGLSLTKGYIQLHGGEIWVESIPDHETKFTFTLLAEKSCFKPSDFIKESIENVHSPYLFDNSNMAENEESRHIERSDKNIILIVEDNSDLRLFLKSQFENEYTVVVASNGKSGLKKAIEITPDIIISDVVMPVMNGIEMCRAIKTNLRTSHIPIILLTAKTTANEQIEGFESGADAYITKPFHLNLLKTQVCKLIQSRQELYAQFSRDVYIIPKKQSENEIDKMFLQKTIEHILTNINKVDINVDSLAKLHSMSRSSLYRKIKALTGSTIIDFIKIIRLKESIKLIETKKHNISEISYMVGFSSPSYFTKTFKDFYGTLPSEYLN